jgi:hypothetical protein
MQEKEKPLPGHNPRLVGSTIGARPVFSLRDSPYFRTEKVRVAGCRLGARFRTSQTDL